VPKCDTLSQGGAPRDPETLCEVLGCLEDMKVGVISCSPRLAESIMSDAALVIRALAQRAGVKIGERRVRNNRLAGNRWGVGSAFCRVF